MKRIIKGKRYDTFTARRVAEWENMPYATDMDWYCENLYQKRNGEYFLHGAGNARSKYAKNLGDNHWGASETIIPLSYESARQWAEEHMDADDYEREFGEVSEDDAADVILSVRVSPAAKAALDRAASISGRSKGDIVSKLLLTLK